MLCKLTFIYQNMLCGRGKDLDDIRKIDVRILHLFSSIIVRVSQTELPGSWLGRSIDP